jgi:hypothetical protein
VERSELKLRLTLKDPPAGVMFSLQDKDDAPAQATLAAGGDLSFDLAIGVGDDGEALRFLGPFVRGPAGDKFVYWCSGTLAGQQGSPWTRRGKLKLGTLDPAMVREAITSDRRLEAVVPGVGKDGGPFCATVKLLEPWRMLGAGD